MRIQRLFLTRSFAQARGARVTFPALGRFFSTQGATDGGVFIRHLDSDNAGVSVIELNVPKANALSLAVVEALEQTFDAVRARGPETRALIIHSTLPKIFCAGADLKERATMSQSDVDEFVQRLRSLFCTLEDLPVPTIAAIDGAALGGGLELALACDLRVCSPRAILGLPETRLAIIPGAGGTQRLPRLIGRSKAKELIFTAKRLDGNEAAQIGLANAVSDNGRTVLEEALTFAREIAKGGPVALRAAKQAVNQGSEVSLDQAFKIERECYAQVIPTADRLEGLLAFKEKRVPKYTGK